MPNTTAYMPIILQAVDDILARQRQTSEPLTKDEYSSGLESAISDILATQQLKNINPDDAKYASSSEKLSPYFSAEGEWNCFAKVQLVLLETRAEFGKAEQKHVEELRNAIEKYVPLNAARFEDKLNHDQLAVLEELGQYVSQETKALLHPGTTSYDIVDTSRSYLLQHAWTEVVRPKISEVIIKLCDLADTYSDVIQKGRTHLQDTSSVSFGGQMAIYAARLADSMRKCDYSINDLRGKISGIVGTGASIDAVIGEGLSIRFEEAVLSKLGLKPDYTATQIVQKERLCDVGNGIARTMNILADFANDMRILYQSAIKEVCSRDASRRLGGSSADASKDNPINWENIAGKAVVVQAGMYVLHELIKTDLQRDLRGSVQARYEPQLMITRTYESFERASKALDKLSVNKDMMDLNLQAVRDFPSEAMVAILRGQGYIHPQYGVGHDAVKKFSQAARGNGQKLIDVARQDVHFAEFFETLDFKYKRILEGKLELYLGSAHERLNKNVEYAKAIVNTAILTQQS